MTTFVDYQNGVYFELAAEQIEIGLGHSKPGHAVLDIQYLRIHDSNSQDCYK